MIKLIVFILFAVILISIFISLWQVLLLDGMVYDERDGAANECE